jgi:uncharacterized protein
MPPHAECRMQRTVAAAAAWVVLSLPWVAPASAATFPDLYTVTVEVAPESDSAARRAQAVEQGMRQLLKRITGRSEAESSPELQPLLRNAANYVNSYAFLNRQFDQVGFNATSVNAALTAADWPIWGAERPMTLLWIAVDGGNGERALLSAADDHAEASPEMAELMGMLDEELTRSADEFGLPVTLPLLDLEDLVAVSFADVWGGFDARIEQASRRYAADAYLVAQVRVSPFGLDIRWTLDQGGRRRVALTNGVRDGLSWLADQYAADFGSSGGNRSIRLSVVGIDSLDDYGRVMRYLESLSILQSVDVEGLTGAQLDLSLVARGDDTVLERVFALGGVLQPARQPVFDDRGAGALIFELSGAASQR